MIGFETILFGLLIVSVLTGLTTEAIKNVCSEHNLKYHANTLAGVVALFLSVVIGLGYTVLMNIDITTQVVVYLIALTFMSWLCAMVGYDKVIQAISQFKTSKKEG